MWGGGYQSEVIEISLVQLGGVGRRLPVRGNRDISGPARRCGEEDQLEVTEISLVQLGGVERRLPVRGNRDISGPARRCGEEANSQR